MRKNKTVAALLGALVFSLTVAAIVMVSVLIYDRVSSIEGITGWQVSLVMLLLIVFLAIVCTLIDVVRRKIMVERPVSKILTATDRITAGDFSYRTEPQHPYGSYDEYDLIIDNVNKMAEELERSEMLKSDFIANVSHELKTPMAVIQGYAQALSEPSLSDAERERCSVGIARASARLGSLVTNILKLNKLEGAGIHPECEQFDLTASISEVILSFEEIIEEKDIELTCELSDVTLVSSPAYLELVWANLISNALKFTEAGGKVYIALFRKGSDVIFKIRDTGCGIPKEVGARIFEKFYQADTSHKGEGNGLGLALVKRVIDILGGAITVSSELGVGCTFTVVLRDNG